MWRSAGKTFRPALTPPSVAGIVDKLTQNTVRAIRQGLVRAGERWQPGFLFALLGFLLALALAYEPGVFDLPVARALNQMAHRNARLDVIFWSLDSCFLFSGGVLTMVVWQCWFSTEDLTQRGGILLGTLISFPVGCVSRFLQHVLETHPRPIYDPVLHFRPPFLFGDTPLNTWNSFPSDHATVFGALLTVVCIARPRLARWLIPYFIVVESARVYMGAHYPSDLLGGALLGVMAVWLMHTPYARRVGRALVCRALKAPAVFYPLAFLFSCRLSMLFLESRVVASYLLHPPVKHLADMMAR